MRNDILSLFTIYYPFLITERWVIDMHTEDFNLYNQSIEKCMYWRQYRIFNED